MNNKRKKLNHVMLVLGVAFLAGCAGLPSANPDLINGIDSLVSEIANRAVEIIPSDSDTTVAVYYFTVDGKESNISDYLITGITTGIANLSGDRTTMVSRQGLDRIMSEYSFQVSDLVSEETQVDIGELLGADIILIGFINPLEDYDKINIQLINVETGAVIGGFFLDYSLESGFERDGTSSIVKVGNGITLIPGVTTVRTIYEDFEGPVVHVNPDHFEEFWGERILSASAKTSTDDDGYGYWEFKAEFDTLDMLEGWDDSDLTFYLSYKTDWIPGDQTGIAVDIFPMDFGRITLLLQQVEGDALKTFVAPLTVTPGEWSKLLIPFDSFKDTEGPGGIDYSKPLFIGFGVPFRENYSGFFFRDETSLESSFMVDNLGFFKMKEKDPEGLIEAYEDEVIRIPSVYEIGGNFLYVDYSDSDEGELKENDGVEWQYLEKTIEEDGPSGRFLRLYGELEINDNLLDFIDNGQDLYVVYRFSSGIDWSEFNNLSFLIKSDLFEDAYIDVTGHGTDQYYSTGFSLNSGWSSVKIPFTDLHGEDGSMENIPLETNQVWVTFAFTLPKPILTEYVDYGSIEFEIDLDQLLLQD